MRAPTAALIPIALALGCSLADGDGGRADPLPPQQPQAPFLQPQAPFLQPQVAQPCGDAAARARFEACKAAAGKREQAACEAAGGTWGRIGLHEGCNCPTGQGGCPCRGPADCLSECVAEGAGRGCPETVAAGDWRCAPYHDVVGCHCYLDPAGRIESICAD